MVGADYIKLIWVPDTFFVNEKEARFHAATQVGMQKCHLTIVLNFQCLGMLAKIPKRETLGPVELVFKNKGRNYGHFERVKVEKRDKN